jgi:RES domain-containing protein
MTAVKEANQGLARRIDPCVLCSYDVDCDDVVDLRTTEGRAGAGIELEDMACAWMDALAGGARPASWSIYKLLAEQRKVGILVPSFAPGADADDQNLVLWDWNENLPHRVTVIDPHRRLPQNQLS